MTELSLKQITNKLNSEFTGDVRKLVFWYDEKAEFVDDIETLELENAKVYRLAPDNQFNTKYLLERLDTVTNYLIYAPFPKPPVRDNHLADTIKYSREFFADRASLLSVDLGIDEKYKPVIQQYIKFFAAKDRMQRFYDLELEHFNRDTIEIALMSVLCKTRTASFEEVVRVALTEDRLEDNRFVAEFEKYDLLPAFWRLCEEHFGYTDYKPMLEKLAVTMFVTCAARYIKADLPQPWRGFISYKSGSIIAFLDSLMNSVLYRESFDEMAVHIAAGLNATQLLKEYPQEALLECELFPLIDDILISWIIGRELDEDIMAQLGGMTIPELCEARAKKHYGNRFLSEYQVLGSAYYVVAAAKYHCPPTMKEIIGEFRSARSIDNHYRHFYYNYDRLNDTASFERLRELVENIYTNEYLAKLLPKWNDEYLKGGSESVLPSQADFYNRYVRHSKERIVVIISDALRYEVGQELWQKLQADEKCDARIDAILGVLPSYTAPGMAALLPHKTLELTLDGKAQVDGKPSSTTEQRQAILQGYMPSSRCVQYSDIKSMKRADLRQVFTGMDVVYIYHNQIDSRGESPASENEVFDACSEAITEIHALIKHLNVSANTVKFVVTADHGFIYKRDKLQESDKISMPAAVGESIGRRHILSEQQIVGDGVASMPLNMHFAKEDTRFISYPISSNVFKAPGGLNYVHGGSSPQELILPVIEVRAEKYHMDTSPAQITLVSMVQKITNLITSLDFLQTEPISDTVKSAVYRVYFISEDNERISNEILYQADKKDTDPQKRIFRLRFTFKNKQYSKTRKYYLVACDERNSMESLRHEVIMDLAFTDDFGL